MTREDAIGYARRRKSANTRERALYAGHLRVGGHGFGDVYTNNVMKFCYSVLARAITALGCL